VALLETGTVRKASEESRNNNVNAERGGFSFVWIFPAKAFAETLDSLY